MDAGLITAIVGALATIGGGAWKLIDRADKKREKREAAVEDLLNRRIAQLEAEAAEAKAQLAKTLAEAAAREENLRRYNSRITASAGKWREQLIAAQIQPDPEEWPEK